MKTRLDYKPWKISVAAAYRQNKEGKDDSIPIRSGPGVDSMAMVRCGEASISRLLVQTGWPSCMTKVEGRNRVSYLSKGSLEQNLVVDSQISSA